MRERIGARRRSVLSAIRERESQPFFFSPAATRGSDDPVPALTFDLTLIGEDAPGPLDEPAPLAAMPVTDCGVDISFVELRKVGDETVVEKAYVFNAARGDEFMKDWQFDSRDAGICHRSCLTCGSQDSENRKAEGGK